MIDKNDPRLTAYVLGELAEEEQAEIQSAVDASSELREVVEEIRGTIASVKSVFAAEPECGLADEQRAEILAASGPAGPDPETDAVTLPSNQNNVTGLSGMKALVAAIAAVLLIGVTVVLVQPDLVSSLLPEVAQADGNAAESPSSSPADTTSRSGPPEAEANIAPDRTAEDRQAADGAVAFGSRAQQSESDDAARDYAGGAGGELSEGSARGEEWDQLPAEPGQSGQAVVVPQTEPMQRAQNRSRMGYEDGPAGNVAPPSAAAPPRIAGRPGRSNVDSEFFEGADFDGENQIAGEDGEVDLRGGMNMELGQQVYGLESSSPDPAQQPALRAFAMDNSVTPQLNESIRAIQPLEESAEPQGQGLYGGRGLGGGGFGGGGGSSGGEMSGDSGEAFAELESTVDDIFESSGRELSDAGEMLSEEEMRSDLNRSGGMEGALADEARRGGAEFALPQAGGQAQAGQEALGTPLRFQTESTEIAQNLFERVDPSATRELSLMRLAPVENSNESLFALQMRDMTGAWQEQENLDGVLAETSERFRELARESGLQDELTDEQLMELLKNEIEKRNEEVRRNRTWRRSRATPNASRLMLGDNDELELQGMEVNVQVEGFRARVLIDCFYYNDRSEQLEGTFKLRLPDDASLYYFAFGQSVIDYADRDGAVVGIDDQIFPVLAEEEFLDQGQQFVSLRPENISQLRRDTWENVKEARMVQKEKAAHAYTQTVRRRVDPALVEWAGAGVFNARVFPLMPQKQHRIVIGYDVDLKRSADGWTYELDLPDFAQKCRVSVDVLQVPGATMTVLPEVKPEELESDDSGNHWRFSFTDFATESFEAPAENGPTESGPTESGEESGEAESDENEHSDGTNGDRAGIPARKFVRLSISDTGPVLLRSNDASEDGFFATRVVPDLPEVEAVSNPHGMFLLDTSLSSQPEKFNVWINMLRQTLDANRDSMTHFNVLFFNVENHFWKNDGYVENTPANVEALIERCEQLALEGATDLYSAIRTIGETEWVGTEGAKPDIFLLSDGAANWGETNQQLTVRQFEDCGLGSLFAYQTGLNGTAIANLRFIAGQTGGAVFSISSEAEIETARTAHRNRPWVLNSIEVDGGKDLMTAGRARWIYPGQALTIVGRVDDSGAETLGGLRLNVSQGAEEKSVDIAFENELKSTLASRIYGAVSTGQLESLGEAVVDVSTAYARHFRITGSTCSLLMLESEEDYRRFNIKPEEDLFVIRSKEAGNVIDRMLEERAEELRDPQAQLIAWLDRLESMPGIEFEMPTALGLVIEDMEVVAISESLNCEPALKADMGEAYAQMLSEGELDYSMVRREAIRRSEMQAEAGGREGPARFDTIDPAFADDALKVMSNLVEMNAGDEQLARDVAFTAMELNRPAQAYHLLRRVVAARPFDPSVYAALGQCLSQLGQADMAMIYYEIAVSAQFPNRGDDYRRIAATDYVHLLNRIVDGQLECSVGGYAEARLSSLTENLDVKPQDLVVTMMWNTDMSDVDLHVIEPSGEECFYQHQQTRSGGLLSRDITDGYGPEMYTLTNAPEGEYQVLVNYYADNQNRTDMRSKVYLTIYRNFGSPDVSVIQRTIELNKVGGKQMVETLSIKK